jgi:hypothetical protein
MHKTRYDICCENEKWKRTRTHLWLRYIIKVWRARSEEETTVFLRGQLDYSWNMPTPTTWRIQWTTRTTQTTAIVSSLTSTSICPRPHKRRIPAQTRSPVLARCVSFVPSIAIYSRSAQSSHTCPLERPTHAAVTKSRSTQDQQGWAGDCIRLGFVYL